jgi:alkylated DNA repair dioxygenase AlkB
MDAPVTYVKNFIDPKTATVYFDRLWAELDWQFRPNTPRREYWYNILNRPYTYGKRELRTYEPQAAHELITEMTDRIYVATGISFEGCFLNGYKDGLDSLGFHADDDPGIDHTKPIPIITLGQERVIKFRRVLVAGSDTVKPVFGDEEKLLLEHGSVAIMEAGMQSTHQHAIPKSGFHKPRISATFRGLI